MRTAIAIPLMCGLLAGCTSGGCDPSRADLFSGIGCAVSGDYARRTADLQQGVDDARLRAGYNREQLARAEADRAAAEDEHRQRLNQLALLDGRLGALKARIAEARRRGVDEGTLAPAQQRANELDRQRGGLSPAASRAELERLSRGIDELNHQIDRR